MDTKTCPRCHVEKPHSAFPLCKSRKDGLQVYCLTCHTAAKKAWRQANPEKVAAAREARKAKYGEEYLREIQRRAGRKHYAKNREACIEASRLWRAQHPHFNRDLHLRHMYKMSAEQFDALWQSQNGQCAICHDPLRPGNGTHIDHDHACCTGEKTCGECIRGLLCGQCNRMLGCARDNPTILRAGADYLTTKIAGTCSPSPSPSSPSPR